MSDVEKKTKESNVKYILLFLLILLTGLGIWKCSNLSKEKSKIEVSIEKENSSKEALEKSAINMVEKALSSTKRNAKEENKSITLKPSEKDSPRTITSKKNEEFPLTKMEEFSKTETKRENIVPNKKPFNEEVVVYRANKNIDKRSPATSNIQCNATNLFKIVKPSFQVSVGFSPDGSNFAVGSLDDYVIIMDMEGKEILKLIGHDDSVQSIKYSPDGKFIITGSGDHTAKLWDTSNGKEIRSLEGHTNTILCVAYSPNGKYIATASMDHTAIIWDSKSGNKLFQLRGHKREVSETAFSNDSKLLITGSSDNSAKVWDVRLGKILYSIEEHSGGVSGLTFTKDDKLILTGGSDKKIRLWDTKTGNHIHTINGHKAWINSIKISSDGENILSTDLKGIAKIWKIKGGKELCELKGHTARIREAVFHPINKNIVASVGNDNTIRMWKFELE